MSVAPISYAARSLRLRLPKVCVAVTGTDAAEMLDKAETLVRENPFLEFRLDYLKAPLSAIPRIKRLFEYRPDVIAIATCRRAANGGRFRGSAAAQIEVLEKAAAAGCQMVDVELESAEALKHRELEKLRTGATLLLSYHDFKATRKLDETFERMKVFQADFYKVVSTATSLHDNVTMMKFLQKTSDHHWMVGLCMGEQGIISRVLGVRAGSIFTFASAGPGEETGPGQVTARELRETYRIDQVDAVTKVYGVAGDPVSQSKSPVMMNTAFRRENVHGVYLALHAKHLDDLLVCIRDIPLHGVSVTMPYKREIVEHLDNSDPLTAQSRSCNTVVRGQDGRLFGFNTDVAGMQIPLEKHISLQGAKILLLGAGGLASAAAFGLKAKGADIYLLNRTPQHAQSLAKKAQGKTVKRSDLPKLTFDVILNATPVGMGNKTQSPLEENELNAKIVFDAVYNPLETKLLKMARGKGLTTIPGIEMFVGQGARQFEIWTGKPAPLEDMYNAVLRQLGDTAPATPSAPAPASPAEPANAAPAPQAPELAKPNSKPAKKHTSTKKAASPAKKNSKKK